MIFNPLTENIDIFLTQGLPVVSFYLFIENSVEKKLIYEVDLFESNSNTLASPMCKNINIIYVALNMTSKYTEHLI